MRTIALALLVVAGFTGTAQALTPTETVQRRVEQAIQAMSLAPRGPDGAAVRRAGIRRAADELFDWNEMARRSLGRHWDVRSPAERADFVNVFTALMARAYLGKIDQYGGETVVYLGERIDGKQALVQTRVITSKRADVPIEYRLHKVGDRWAAYDVSVDNVSLVVTYRSQFDRIMQAGNFADVMKRMRAKEAEARLADASR